MNHIQQLRREQKRRYERFRQAARVLAGRGVPVEVPEYSNVQVVEGGAYVEAQMFVSDKELATLEPDAKEAK